MSTFLSEQRVAVLLANQGPNYLFPAIRKLSHAYDKAFATTSPFSSGQDMLPVWIRQAHLEQEA